ncbi:MAG: cytochrome c3 family protein [Anaerolineae bacterium]
MRGHRGALVAAIVAVPVLALAFFAFESVTHQPSFCATCHEMRFYYDTWLASSHGVEATCTACHTQQGVAGYFDEKGRALHELIVHFSGSYEVPIQTAQRVKNAQCLACHDDVATLPEGERTAAHGAHLAANVLCADCHGRLVHADAQRGEQRLIDNAGCEACHQAHVDFLVVTGAHATVDCAECHAGGVYTAADPACESCHQPPAVHPGRDSGCQECHSVQGWTPAVVDHDQTGFPLTGQHELLTCAQCHGEPLGPAAGTACATCHEAPASHAGMSDACEDCHTTEGFTPAQFTHAPVGEHMPAGRIRLTCSACHRTGVFSERHCTGAGCHTSDNPQEDDD